MIELSTAEIMLLIQIASKACEYEEEFVKGLFPEEMLIMQVRAAIVPVKSLLAELDKEYPGMIPVPHDGVPWGEK